MRRAIKKLIYTDSMEKINFLLYLQNVSILCINLMKRFSYIVHNKNINCSYTCFVTYKLLSNHNSAINQIGTGLIFNFIRDSFIN